jgi:hypothetical protein
VVRSKKLLADRARQAFESHLARAKWMARDGYRHLLRRGWPRFAHARRE